MTNFSFGNYLLNFGFASKAEKRQVLTEHPDKHVYMDLTCYDPAEFYADFPQLKGAFAGLFCDEEKRMEIHYRQKAPEVEAQLREMGFHTVETSIISCGFIFPRTIAQIINEAFFALEEGVAGREDIDRAMKFGVNYPKGPFEWARDRELFVRTLLLELQEQTGDARYRPAPSLSK
jgi:3-hydroxybutyryl-CoA dehydrogenase